MGIEALLSTQIIDTTTVGRAVMTAADAAAARTAIDAAATSHTHAASDITSGIIATARLATGTADSTTYLRGDQTWATIASGGISSLNGLTDATQTFQTGTTGTNFGIVSTAGVHTFNLPDASATARGVVTTGAQTIAGAKTFSSKITAPATGNANSGGIGNGGNGVDFYRGLVVYIVGNGSSQRYPFYFSLSTTGGNYPHLKLASDTVIGWDSATDATTTQNPGATQIARWADYHVTIRNSTFACSFSVVNTYTSSTSFERLLISWESNVCTIECDKGSAGGTLRGLRIGGATTSLLGFYGATPVDRPDTVADPTGGATVDAEARTAIGLIIDRLQELGLIA